MGIYTGRGSLRDFYPSLPPVSQPDPYNFKVLTSVSRNGNMLALVEYPDATNFEGRKILLIANRVTLQGVVKLDPHFLENNRINIVARFQPTDEGWELGMKLLKNM